MPLDDIVVVVDAQMPVRAKRVVYYEDPFFKGIHAAQEGELPFPEAPVAPMEHQPLSVRAAAIGPRGPGLTERDFEARMGIVDNRGNTLVEPGRQTETRQKRAAVIVDEQGQMEMDFVGGGELQTDEPSDANVAQVRDALSELDRLEGEVLGEFGSVDQHVEKAIAR